MRYEVINPSDPYFIDGEFPAVAAAVTLLGEGAYGAEPVVKGPDLDARELPPLVFTPKPLDVFAKIVGEPFDTVMDNQRDGIVAALRTVALPDGKERSSMNDIGRRAQRLADALEKRAAKVPPPVAPPSPVMVMGATTPEMTDFLDSAILGATPAPVPPEPDFVPGGGSFGGGGASASWDAPLPSNPAEAAAEVITRAGGEVDASSVASAAALLNEPVSVLPDPSPVDTSAEEAAIQPDPSESSYSSPDSSSSPSDSSSSDSSSSSSGSDS